MSFDDVLDDGETKPAAFCVMNESGVDSIEFLEDLLLFRAMETDSSIGDLDRKTIPTSLGSRLYALDLSRIPDCIIEQIENCLRYRLAIDHRRRQVGFENQIYAKAFVSQLRLITPQRVHKDFSEIRFSELVFSLSGFDTREIEDVINELCET